MRFIKWIYIPLSAAIMAGCAAKGERSGTEENVVLPVASLIEKDTLLHRTYVAAVQAVQNVEVRARVSGFLNGIHVDEGQEVKKGQLLFTISDEEYSSQLARAKAALENVIADAKAAKLETDRVRLLVEKKVVAESELEVAKARLLAANAKVAEARSAETNAVQQLSYTRVLAPFNGVIDRIPLKKGSLVDEGTLFTTVSDTREVYTYFNVSETEYLRYMRSLENGGSKHNEVALELADGSRYAHMGKIETMDGEIENTTGSIAFRARFPNPHKLLKHGASGKVILSTELDAAMIIPQKAVFEMQDKNYVFVVDKDNRVKMKSFEPLTRFAGFYIVEKGLNKGERIVCEGVRSVRDGMEITPRVVYIDSLLNT